MCAIDLFSKYAWVIPLKDKKGVRIFNAFQKLLDSSNRKSNKIWVDQDSEFYNNSFKDFLKINSTEMYSTYNEGKSVVAERFIRTLKNKIFKHMTAISKNVYFDVLDDIVNKYNNTVHRTVKMKSTDVTDNSYAEYNDNFNRKDPKFKVINDLNSEKIIGTFYEKELQNTNKEEFRIEKVLKRKGDKLYVKWKGYDNSFNGWIDKKDLI